MLPFEQLEAEWAKFNDLDPTGMVACSSGTAALHLALEALQMPPGSEVLVPDFTMIACPRAVTLAGLVPVFVDCDERLLIDQALLPKEVIGYALQAVMAVHIYGRRCDMEKITAWADDQACWIIEDLAEAHGIRPHLSTDAACWSFYRNKIVAGEEGGAVWFRDPKHAALARQLRSLGFTDAHDFWHVPRGHNYRMSNLHADWIMDNLQYVRVEGEGSGYRTRNPNGLPYAKRNMERRREIEGWYDKHCPDEWRMPPRDAVWVFDLKLPVSGSYELIDKVVKALRDDKTWMSAGKQYGARHGFKPCFQQPEYQGSRIVQGRSDGTSKWMRSVEMSQRVMYLPVLPGQTTEEDCQRAFEVIKGTYILGSPRVKNENQKG